MWEGEVVWDLGTMAETQIAFDLMFVKLVIFHFFIRASKINR